MISYTQLSTYNTCPLLYEFKYVKQVEEPLAPLPVRVGRALHTAIEMYLTSSISERAMAEDKAWMFLSTAVNLEDLREMGSEMEEVFNEFISRFELDFSADPQVETEIVTPSTDFYPSLKARLDLVYFKDGIVKVIDFKTGHAFVKDLLQAEIYAWAIFQTRSSVDMVVVEYDYIRHHYQEEFLFERDKVESAISLYIQQRANLLKNGPYNPQVGPHCSHCPYAHLCPALKDENGSPQFPLSSEQAESLALEYIRTQARLEAIKKSLSGWVKELGPVRVGDVEVGLFPRSSVKYDVAKFIEKAKERGLDPAQFLSVNRTRLRRYADEFQDCILEEKKAMAWGIKKVKEEGNGKDN